jgi:hypothetical protein
MAKKQITPSSSPTEIRIANEQLARAQQEYKQIINQKYAGKDVTLATLDREAQSIAAKYDYVDYGQLPPPPSVKLEPGELYIGGSGFFVKGFGDDTKVTFSPESKTTVNQDDAAIPSNTGTSVTSNPNPQGVNPKAAKTDQSTAIESAPVTATQSQQVQPETPLASGTNTGAKEAEQIGAAIESNNKNQSTQNQTGIVNENLNQLPTTNNLPGRLSDEFLREPAISDSRKSGNTDDAGKPRNVPFGTAFNGFINPDAITVNSDAATIGTGGVTIGTTSQGINVPNQAAGTPNNPNVPLRPNILHNYANWTYKISLYLLGLNDYNSIMEGGVIPEGARQYTIAKSGGYQRQQGGINFEKDFSIDSLRFTSVIGNRLTGTATNNIDLSMEITEPYGASFVGELAALAGEVNGINITLAENPYLLEIDFTGYTDAGVPVESILDKGKKYIPVKIISIDMKLDSGGAKYTLGMVPYGFYQYTPKRASLTKGEYVQGKTLLEIAGPGESGLIGRLNLSEVEKVTKDQKQEYPDKYKIEFYSFNKTGSRTEELQNSKVAFPLKNGGEATSINERVIDNNDPTIQGYKLANGTLIKEAIKDLVLASEYFNTKMKPAAQESNSDPAQLIKIIPQIKLITNQWDKKRNEYAKEITFHVFNTLLFGENFKNGGLAPIRDWGYSKVYDWIFTGKNEDIINVDINFNLLYYTRFFTDKNELGLIMTGMEAARTSTPGLANPNKFSEQSSKPGSIGKTFPNEPSRYINSSLAAEFFDLKMNNSYADNITLDMDIIGDPDWIPQDASVRGGPITVGNFNSKLDQWNSLAIDVAGVYAKLRLRTPRDYNDTTGLMDLNTDSSFVGGVYQVITVENLFESGRYTCKLNMVKIPNQEENEKPSPGSISNPTLPGNPR